MKIKDLKITNKMVKEHKMIINAEIRLLKELIEESEDSKNG